MNALRSLLAEQTSPDEIVVFLLVGLHALDPGTFVVSGAGTNPRSVPLNAGDVAIIMIPVAIQQVRSAHGAAFPMAICLEFV